jgi:hypothetical protein
MLGCCISTSRVKPLSSRFPRQVARLPFAHHAPSGLRREEIVFSQPWFLPKSIFAEDTVRALLRHCSIVCAALGSPHPSGG